MAVWTVYLSICLFFPLAASDTCDSGWAAHGCRCFKFFNTPKTWIEAEKTCLAYNGNLASVHTHSEYTFIQNLTQDANHALTEAWIGGSDAVLEGTWLWSDGSRMNFELWAPGQQDVNNKPHEDCLGMNFGSSGNWNDYTCDWNMTFVCVKK
ncbi:hypothetical protein ABG768_009381 [Culter alburnus]|uniref:C-type lectin domain-containing protein n=1 Tax=Culter alburnus TaxID=194366 RepID=A0AAW1ZJI0_CULAL